MIGRELLGICFEAAIVVQNQIVIFFWKIFSQDLAPSKEYFVWMQSFNVWRPPSS